MHLKSIIDYVVDTNLSIFILTNKSLGSIIHRIIPGNPSIDWNFPKFIFGNLFIFKKCSERVSERLLLNIKGAICQLQKCISWREQVTM